MGSTIPKQGRQSQYSTDKKVAETKLGKFIRESYVPSISI